MIVDHVSKINLNRSNSANPKRTRAFLQAVGRVGLILVASTILCQSSSAQQTANSTKVTKKRSWKAKSFVALGRFEDQKISESSGLATAHSDGTEGISSSIWTFNDSGGEAVLFRVSVKGKNEAKLKLKGATNRDWETMCGFSIGKDRFLAVGDVGDNSFRHKSYQIYVVAEPAIASALSESPKLSKKGKAQVQDLKSVASTIDFQYEDGPHNCEAMGYNAEDDTFWFVEKVYVDDKRKSAPGIYVLPNPLQTSTSQKRSKKKNVARRIADFPIRNVTGMAFSPNNQRLVIRNYFGAWIFEKTAGKTWQETVVESKPKAITLPLQSQGEAICFAADGQSLLVTSEFKNAIIWQVSLADATKENDEPKK